MKHGTVTPYLKDIPKHIDYVTHPLSCADVSILHQKLAILVISRNKDYNCFLTRQLWFFWPLMSYFKVVLRNMTEILTMSAKLTTPGFLEFNVVWNQG